MIFFLKKGAIMNKDASENEAKAGDLKLPGQVKLGTQKKVRTKQTAAAPVFSNLKNLQSGLIVSFAFTAIVFITSIVVMTGLESRLADLEDEVFFLEDTVSSLESDVSYLEDELAYTKDWAYGELDSVQNCVNDFIDSWSQRLPAYYCQSPLIP